jgi:hypothetical protein
VSLELGHSLRAVGARTGHALKVVFACGWTLCLAGDVCDLVKTLVGYVGHFVPTR